jgi:hypothetical protein
MFAGVVSNATIGNDPIETRGKDPFGLKIQYDLDVRYG